MKDSEFKACLDQAERFLVIREHNKNELRDKLKNKKHSPETIDKTIDFLLDEGELSEERYIRSFIRSSNARHPEGASVMLRRLAEKGADRQLSKEIVAEIYTEEYTLQMAKACLAKNLKKTEDSLKIKQKLSQAGFSYHLITSVI